MSRKPKKTETEISRQLALTARPKRTKVKTSKPDEKGELHLTMEYVRPRWQRWMGADEHCERIYVLDVLGRAVYERCDGSCSVQEMIRPFAEEHKVSIAEAEYSVTTYLKTLMAKGLVAMVVDKKAK